MADRVPPGRPSNRASTLLVVGVMLVATVAGAGALAVGAASPAQEDGDGADDSRENAVPVSMNTTFNGTIDGPNDTDWYAVEVDDRRTLLAALSPLEDRSSPTPTESSDDSHTEPKLLSITIVGPDGEELGYERDDITHPGLSLTENVETGDTYYVKVSSEYGDDDPNAREATGSKRYRLSVDSVRWDPYEPNDYSPEVNESAHNQRSNVANISAGERALAHTTGLERDSYALHIEEGERVRIWYKKTGVFNPKVHSLEHDIGVYGPNGDRVSGGTQTFIAEKSGTYIVTIGPGGEREAWTVEDTEINFYNMTVTTTDRTQGDGEETPAETDPPTTTAPTDERRSTAECEL